MTMTLPTVIPDLAELGARAADFARAARAPATDRAYRTDWADFTAWCSAADLCVLPAEPTTIGAYLSDRAGKLKPGTLARRVAAIASAHRLVGYGLDTSHLAIARVLAGIRRTYGSRPDAKTALMTEDLRRMVRALPSTPAGVRDRAVLLVGFAGAFRRSELVALDRVDLEINSGGLIAVIRRSKTDQEGAGRQVGIPRSRKSATCPVAALEAWVQETAKFLNLSAEDWSGSVFRTIDHGELTGRLTGDGVAQIVKRAAARVGIDPAKVAAHSLRSGFATSAARGGADLSFIMQQTGHRNADVARRYVQRGQILQNPASKAVKL